MDRMKILEIVTSVCASTSALYTIFFDSIVRYHYAQRRTATRRSMKDVEGCQQRLTSSFAMTSENAHLDIDDVLCVAGV